MKKNLRIILLFCLALFNLNNILATETGSFDVDTLVFTNKEGKEITTPDATKIVNSKDNKAIAELFYNTAYATANKKDANDSDFDFAIKYFDFAIYYFEKANAINELALCFEHKAAVDYNLSNYERAITLFQKAIKEYEKLDSTHVSQIAELNNNCAFIYLNTHRFENAVRFFKIGLNKYIQLQDTLNIGINYYQIGLSFYEAEKFDSALVYYNKALKYDLISGDKKEIIASYNNLSVLYMHLNEFDLAFENLEKSSKIINETKNEDAEAIYANNIANIYFKRGDYATAITFYKQSLELKKKLNDKEGQAISLQNLAKVYSKTDVDKGINSISQALKLTESKIANKTYGSVCKTASELYEQKGEYELAHKYYELFIKNSFSILSVESEQISETQTKHKDERFKAESIQREIKMQEMFAAYEFNIKKNKINSLQKEREAQRTTVYILAGLVLLIILGFILLYNRYLIKKRANKRLELQNEEIEKQTLVISKQADELLASNRELEKLSIVASNTDNAILIMDADGNFEWVNSAFTKMFGYTINELKENVSSNMISENTPDYIKQEFDKCRLQKLTANYDFKTKNIHGKEIWANVTLTPILNEDGELSRMVMIDSDITALKNAETEIRKQKDQIENQKEEITQQRDTVLEQSKEIEAKRLVLVNTLEQLQATQNKLVESEKMASLGGLVAGISHEINTPVGVGTAASTTLLTRTGEIAELFETKKMKLSDLQEFIDTAQNACDLILKNLRRTADLVKSFNKVSVDNMSEEKRDFNLAEYIEDVTRSLAPKFKGRKISLNTNCPDNIELHSYPGAFAQIFTNLIINSLTHGFNELDEGNLSILITETDTELNINYSDNGKGISKENQEKVFEAFYTTNSEVGTGLGMSITYNLVTQKLGGEISLESEENKGVIFNIKLPLANIKA